MLKGIATSSGIAIGKVYKLEQPKIIIEQYREEKKADLEKELTRFKNAMAKTIKDIEQIKE